METVSAPITRDCQVAPAIQLRETLKRLGIDPGAWSGTDLAPQSPIDGKTTLALRATSPAMANQILDRAQRAFEVWRRVPAPRRGELVRLFGSELRARKADLARIVTIEAGKIAQEALGEVQEMIDICDFAVGLSRQLHGLTIASERPGHHMREAWHPMGTCGVITAFNFPVAVWAWNAALALVCGNAVVWKPSEKTPIAALAVQALFDKVAASFAEAPEALASVVTGGRELGELLASDHRVAIVSATGSTAMGRAVAARVSQRFGRLILELGGNNAAIVTSGADLELAMRAIVFSAVGTAGQRCTSLRRLVVHEAVADSLVAKLRSTFDRLPIGDPRREDVLVGPLIDAGALEAMQVALQAARCSGGEVYGGKALDVQGLSEGFYVHPALAQMPAQSDIVRRETFAPILYVMRYRELDEAIALNNGVPQGLASSIFTNDLRESEYFLSAVGSDCGIANVNIGPSGAEIGGAFGGEKETGGGRESGSDAWKAYMRRATNTVNYSRELPLAQGIRFDIAP